MNSSILATTNGLVFEVIEKPGIAFDLPSAVYWSTYSCVDLTEWYKFGYSKSLSFSSKEHWFIMDDWCT